MVTIGDPMTRVVNGGKLENIGKIIEVNGGFLQRTMFDYQIMGNIMEDRVIQWEDDGI